MNDITDLVEAEKLNCLCPLCDCGIEAWEEYAVVKAHGFAVLAHEICLAEEDEDDEEEGDE